MTNGLTISGVNVSDVGSYGMYLYGTDGLTLQNNSVTGSIVIYEHNAFYGHGNDSCTGNGLYVAPSTTINGPIVLKNNVVNGGAITATPTGICYEGNTVDGVVFPEVVSAPQPQTLLYSGNTFNFANSTHNYSITVSSGSGAYPDNTVSPPTLFPLQQDCSIWSSTDWSQNRADGRNCSGMASGADVMNRWTRFHCEHA